MSDDMIAIFLASFGSASLDSHHLRAVYSGTRIFFARIPVSRVEARLLQVRY